MSEVLLKILITCDGLGKEKKLEALKQLIKEEVERVNKS